MAKTLKEVERMVPRDVQKIVEKYVNPAPSAFEIDVDRVLSEIGDMLKAKNRAYGNSAIEPIRIFSRSSPVEQILVRIDDKLSRLMRGKDLQEVPEDTVRDLIGYLVILCIAREADNG